VRCVRLIGYALSRRTVCTAWERQLYTAFDLLWARHSPWSGWCSGRDGLATPDHTSGWSSERLP